MPDKEGLILQGCGGDLTEWVDGINEMLTNAGILKDGSQFENVFAFQHGELTCLLYPFDDVKLDIGKLSTDSILQFDLKAQQQPKRLLIIRFIIVLQFLKKMPA